ncbi:DNA translocase FtsK [compost metagenome]
MQVELMELVHEGVSFKLTHDFKLRAISFHGELTEDEEEQREDADDAFLWRIEAATQLLQLVATIKALCDLFEYKRPELVAAVIPAKDSDSVFEAQEARDLEEVTAFVRESGGASISGIQRKFLWGYNRAARMMDALEADGVVTAMNSNGHREVIR